MFIAISNVDLQWIFLIEMNHGAMEGQVPISFMTPSMLLIVKFMLLIVKFMLLIVKSMLLIVKFMLLIVKFMLLIVKSQCCMCLSGLPIVNSPFGSL
jgi:hypothetical protein